MDGEVAYHTSALQQGYRAPFTAAVSEQDKRDYYRRQMFQQAPDGSIDYTKPNLAGRDQLLKTYGTASYAQIWNAVKPKQGLQPMLPEQDDSTVESEPATNTAQSTA